MIPPAGQNSRLRNLGTTRAAFVTSLAALTAWGGTSMAPARAQALPITVATIGGDIGAQIYYAKELGLFEKAGLAVQIAPFNQAAVPAALLNGSIDVSYYNVLGTAVAHSKGLPFSFVAAANLYVATAVNAGFLAVLNASPIRMAKDLEGKTIGVNGLFGIPEYSARAWIDLNGGDSSKARFVQLLFSEMADAVGAGRVDAASMEVTADPTLGKPGDRFRAIGRCFDAVAPKFMPGGWLASNAWIAAHPVETKAFIGVMRQAAIWANAHHHESAAILAKYSQIPETLLNNIIRATYGTELTAALLQPNIDVAVKYGALVSRFDAQDLISKVAAT
jgi:NitT/TauT family transport system substrate-binding protein